MAGYEEKRVVFVSTLTKTGKSASKRVLTKAGGASVLGALALAAVAGGSVVTAPVASAVDGSSCGMNVGVVLDATWSFTDAELAAEKAQAAHFVKELGQGPGMVIAGSQFGYTSPLWGNGDPAVPMSVDPNSVLPGNVMFKGIDVSTSAGAQDAAARFNGFARSESATGNAASRTNWEAGLRSMSGSGVSRVVFITDGVPNAWGSTPEDLRSNAEVTLQQEALDGAARAIADLKAEGIEVIPLFVKSSAPGLHGMNDPVPGSATPAADIERAMQVLDPSFTIDKALSIDAIADKMLADVTKACTPGLGLDKSHTYDDTNGNGRPDAGDTLVYKFAITNTGQTPLKSLDLQDPMLTSLGITWSYPSGFSGTLAPGESVTATAEPYVITAADELAGGIENIATVSAVNPWNPGKNPPKPTDTDKQPVKGLPPVIDLEKTVKEIKDVNGNGITDKGDTVVYGFKGTNTGTVPLTDVKLTDDMLAAVTPEPVALTPEKDFDGKLAPGASTTWTSGAYTLTQADVDNGLVHNTADLTGKGTDKDKTPVKDTDDADVTPDQKPAIELKKIQHLADTNNDGDADPGEKISYEFVGTNTGNVTLNDVALTDPKLNDASVAITAPEGFKATLAPGESVTYGSGQYTVTGEDAAAGEVKNTATITGTPGKGPKVSDDDTVKLPSLPDPAAPAIVKSGFAPTSGDAPLNPAAGIGAGVLALLGAFFGIKAFRSRKALATATENPLSGQ